MLGRELGGHRLVLFRGADGAVAALDGHCPHLGADLATGGTVVDGALRCAFHGFRYAPDGACVATGYGGKVPPTARLRTWPVRERNGLVLVWLCPRGEAPWFEVPEVERAGWTGWRRHRFELRGHPQEVAENSVDTGHFAVVHGYSAVRELAPLRTDGPLLNARYGFERPRAWLGRAGTRAEIEIFQWGLGYALVEVALPELGLRTRQLVLSLPLGADRLHLQIGMAVREVEAPGRLHWALAGFPARSWLAERIADGAIASYAADVAQDVPFWASKVHVSRPALAEGDGPVGRYRSWVRQFYPPATDGAG